MIRLKFSLITFSLIGAVGCSSGEVGPDSATALNSSPGRAQSAPLSTEGPANIVIPKTHSMMIEKNSAGDSDFAGLYNTFELKATILNSEVRDALINRQGDYFQWDSSQKATEREKSVQEMSSETTAFLSFFTPERRNDNLSDSKSIWRVFIDVGGRRYVGKARRDRRLVVELQSLYPYHTRWNTPYIITFPVATTAIEMQPIRFTLTGPLGTRVLEFAPLGSATSGPAAQPAEAPKLE